MKISCKILTVLIFSMAWVQLAAAQDVLGDSDIDIYRKAIEDSLLIKKCLDRVPDTITPEALESDQQVKDRMIANAKERLARARIQILINRWGILDCGELVSLISMSPSGSYYFPDNSSRPAQYCLFTDRKSSTGNHVSPREAVITCDAQAGGTYFCRDRENEKDYARVFDRSQLNAVKSLRAADVHEKVKLLKNWASVNLVN